VTAKHPEAKLGQSRGKLWAIVDDCPTAIFAAKPDPDDPAKFLLTADDDACQYYDIAKDEANCWIATALRALA
jgi:hypothetical protein